LAGTFPLNCAYLGIPCIAYNATDTAAICHPQTSVELEDMVSAKKVAYRLKNDPDFYMECSRQCKENFDKYYSESVFKSNTIPLLEKLVSE
jgi:hypothetical protein